MFVLRKVFHNKKQWWLKWLVIYGAASVVIFMLMSSQKTVSPTSSSQQSFSSNQSKQGVDSAKQKDYDNDVNDRNPRFRNNFRNDNQKEQAKGDFGSKNEKVAHGQKEGGKGAEDRRRIQKDLVNNWFNNNKIEEGEFGNQDLEEKLVRQKRRAEKLWDKLTV